MFKTFAREPGCQTVAQDELKKLIGRRVDAGIRVRPSDQYLKELTGTVCHEDLDPENDLGVMMPNGMFSIPEDIYRIYPETYAIKDMVIRDEDGERLWLVEEATDLDQAERAILEAKVSGSIGATSSVEDASTREISRYASVIRVVRVKAYGAR